MQREIPLGLAADGRGYLFGELPDLNVPLGAPHDHPLNHIEQEVRHYVGHDSLQGYIDNAAARFSFHLRVCKSSDVPVAGVVSPGIEAKGSTRLKLKSGSGASRATADVVVVTLSEWQQVGDAR